MKAEENSIKREERRLRRIQMREEKNDVISTIQLPSSRAKSEAKRIPKKPETNIVVPELAQPVEILPTAVET
jgi:spore cortex formation protein SpoVR/YcgB (stage V sporulation)